MLPTIADQMCRTIPRFEQHLIKACHHFTAEALTAKPLEKQFEVLISEPLREVAKTESSDQLTRIILLDALDECEDGNKVLALLGSIGVLDEIAALRLRIICTSRNTREMIAFLSKFKFHKRVTLHGYHPSETKADIETYLRDKLKGWWEEDKEWPTEQDLHMLVELSTNPDPLFIYASTMCRFIKDGQRGRNPPEQLQNWLNGHGHGAVSMHATYQYVLQQAFKLDTDENSLIVQDEDEEECAIGHGILACIVVLAEPLPASALACILGMQQPSVSSWLSNFQTVLHVPKDPDANVEILHKSFPDWLLSETAKEGSRNFHVDSCKSNAEVAHRCIQRMGNNEIGLKKDICGLKTLGVEADSIDPDVIAKSIPKDLRYACIYWVYHLKTSGDYVLDSVQIDTFLRKYLLFWLEALSILNRMSEAVKAMSSLMEIYKVCLYHYPRLFN